jgi:hypothetical protein
VAWLRAICLKFYHSSAYREFKVKMHLLLLSLLKIAQIPVELRWNQPANFGQSLQALEF